MKTLPRHKCNGGRVLGSLFFLAVLSLACNQGRSASTLVTTDVVATPISQNRGSKSLLNLSDQPSTHAGTEPIRFKDYVIRVQVQRLRVDGHVGEHSFVRIMQRGKVLRNVDEGLNYPLGAHAEIACYSFLGGKTQQIYISQDVPRGGRQWVIAFEPTFHFIFDGRKFEVGRESDDFVVEDLNADGRKEILVPLTSFYNLQDKMSIARIPLPLIIFQYDVFQREYLPANPQFAINLRQQPDVDNFDSTDVEQQRSVVLDLVLEYIFAGRETEGWQIYDKWYKLQDKEEIRTRIQSIIRAEPVYKFIYKHSKTK